jgi:FixJ family two-component response regulator
MPGMHGRDLVHRLHADRPTLRVLFMSGSSAGPAGESDRVPGNEPFIAKPFTIEALTLKVRQVLDT